MANIGAAPQSSAWPLSPLPLTPDRSSGLSPAVSSLRHLIAQRTEELTHLGDARAAALAQRVRDLENELSRVLALHGNIQESAHATSAALAERDAALAAAQRELARRELALTHARDAAEAARDAALADLSAAQERVQEAVSAAAAADAARESLAKEMLDALRSVEEQIKAERSTSESAIDSLTHELATTKQQLGAAEMQLDQERVAASALAERLNRDLEVTRQQLAQAETRAAAAAQVLDEERTLHAQALSTARASARAASADAAAARADAQVAHSKLAARTAAAAAANVTHAREAAASGRSSPVRAPRNDAAPRVVQLPWDTPVAVGRVHVPERSIANITASAPRLLRVPVAQPPPPPPPQQQQQPLRQAPPRVALAAAEADIASAYAEDLARWGPSSRRTAAQYAPSSVASPSPGFHGSNARAALHEAINDVLSSMHHYRRM